MTDIMAAQINKVAGKLGRKWQWDKNGIGSPSMVNALPQRHLSNDCGTAVNELGRRLLLNESVTEFSLQTDGNKLRARQASEIVDYILTEGVR